MPGRAQTIDSPAKIAAMHVLLIRLSALGDIVHALPAVTDLKRHWPEARIDMAVDERFADIPRLHAGVDRVIPIALKRWKTKLSRASTWLELRHTVSQLRSQAYDQVIDLHGLNKSAMVAWLARSPDRVGPAAAYCGEWLAPRLYHRHCNQSQAWLPVPRMRGVVAAALGRPCAEPLDYGLTHTWTGQATGEVMLIHSTSASDKLWPEENWIAVGRRLIAQGMRPVLPWGSEPEKERSARLAQAMGPAAELPPRRSISEWAQVISRSALVVGVDTGLTHLAAAAGVPCLALFAATGSELFAPQNPDLAMALGGQGQIATLEAANDGIDRLLKASQVRTT